MYVRPQIEGGGGRFEGGGGVAEKQR